MTAPHTTPGRVLPALGPACVGVLGVLYATIGSGWPPRRSAIAFMMGSWGARLAVQLLYTRAVEYSWPQSLFYLPPYAVFFSLPAFLAAANPDEGFSVVEFIASALWLIAFAGETTADRQRLRFLSKPENAGLPCRAGLWRYLPRAHAVCETAIWIAIALFASASPWGWLAFACPAAMLYVEFRRRY